MGGVVAVFEPAPLVEAHRQAEGLPAFLVDDLRRPADDLMMKFVRHLHPFGCQGMAKGTKVHGLAQQQGAINIPQHGTEQMLSWPECI
jgi:hypothetical protein